MYFFYNDVNLNDYDKRKLHNMCAMPGTVSVNELYLLHTSASMEKFIPIWPQVRYLLWDFLVSSYL